MKRCFLQSFGSVQRPVALMLAFISVGSLVFNFYLARWTGVMARQGAMGDPNIAEVLNGFSTFFRDYAMPVLILAVALAVVNVISAFVVGKQLRKAASANERAA